MGEYRLKDTPSGYKTLVYADSGEIRIHSAHDPVKEAERASGSFKKGRGNLIIICGAGLGYHIAALKKRFPDCILIALERDTAVINIIKKIYPDNLRGVSIVTSEKDVSSIFEEIDITKIRGVSAYYHRPSYLLCKEFYNDILKDIKDYITSKVSDLLTRFEFEEKWFENIFKNIHHVFTSAPVYNLFGKFKNYPGIIVSAGPSLRSNVKHLSGMRDRALIVCVDTAFKVLVRNNISPHIVMTLDSQKHSIKHFMGVKDDRPALLADIVSYPRIIETYKGNKLLSTTSKFYTESGGQYMRETTPLWDWLEESAGRIGDIQSGGSVATSVFDLLLNLGCSPIILVGQDLAYTGREIHCTGTHHNEYWLPATSRFQNLETINQGVIRKRKIKYVEAYGGSSTVISDFVFDLYKSWFEDSAKKVNIPVINATEGGAKIKNTKEIPIEKLSGELKRQAITPDEILNKEFQSISRRNYEPLSSELNRASKGINSVKCLSKEELEKENPDDDIVLTVMEDLGVSRIITPFLRKTLVYLERHPDLDSKKAAKLLLTEIAVTSDKLLNLFELSKKNLQNIR